ncbi:MAG: hypothetical protein LBS81_03795 [Endomicrobium sp.]|nr:hypothetical protein [Endomicrobium sp.]
MDITRLSGSFESAFNALFGLNFDGISIEAVNVEDITVLQSALYSFSGKRRRLQYSLYNRI